jgi:hypothetical protein
MPTHRVRPSSCPFCAATLTAADNLPGSGGAAKPRAGDLSVCISCSSILVFGRGRVLRAPNAREWRQIKAMRDWPLLQLATRVVRALDRRERGP